jgi:hypothetical protein
MKRDLCIDTVFRANYATTESSDITFTLPDPIPNVTGMSINAFEIPNCWYTFSEKEKSNEFTIRIYNCPTPSDVSGVYPNFMEHIIRIPEGNYMSAMLLTTINNMFTNIRNGLEYLYFDINEINTRCIFRTKKAGEDIRDIYLDSDLSGSDFYFELDFAVPEVDFNCTAGWMLGFRRPLYTVSKLDTPFVDNYNSMFQTYTYHWYMQGESSYGSSVHNYIFIEIDDFTNSDNTNVMGRLAVRSGINTTVILEPSDLVFTKREYINPVVLSKLRIQLTNKYGNCILMNGNDYSFMLEIEQGEIKI